MPVLNFPANPASQTPPNVYSPTSSPASTSNSITYAWDGVKWISTGAVVPTIDYTYPGGVQQTLQERLEQYVSVTDFGAKGDGVTDDTQAFKKAVASKSKIYVPAGEYVITSNIDAEVDEESWDIEIEGASLASESHGWATDSFSSDFSYSSFNQSKLDRSRHAIIRCVDTPFIGKYDTDSDLNASKGKIRRIANLLLIADNSAKYGIYIQPSDCEIVGCTFVGFGEFGLLIRSGITGKFSKLAFYDNGWNLSDNGKSVTQSSSGYVSGCAIKILGGDIPNDFGAHTNNKQSTTLSFDNIYIGIRGWSTQHQSGYRAIQCTYAYGVNFTNIGSYSGSYFWNTAGSLINYYGENYSQWGSSSIDNSDTHALYLNQSGMDIGSSYIANFSSNNQAIGIKNGVNFWARTAVAVSNSRSFDIVQGALTSTYESASLNFGPRAGQTVDVIDSINFPFRSIKSAFTGTITYRWSNRNDRAEVIYGQQLVNFRKKSDDTYDCRSVEIIRDTTQANADYDATVNYFYVNDDGNLVANMTFGSLTGSRWILSYSIVGCN